MNHLIQAQTDRQNTVQLDSSIIYATWNACRACGGTNVEIEVHTAYVGEGANIQIRLKGEQSGDLGGVDDTMFGNRYIADVPIPASIKVDEKIWFIATLHQHGLSAQSEKIPAVPPIQLVKIEWGQQEARRGDILDIRAEFLGLRDIVPCEVHILEYDADGNHDPINCIPSEIKNGKLNLQWEYEYHEDTDEIPTEEELQKYGSNYNPPEYFFVVEIEGQRFGEGQESGLLEFRDWVELKIPEELRQPSAVFSFQLADNSNINANPDDNGIIKIIDLPPGPVTVNASEIPIAMTFFDEKVKK
jgi:hypothetical protein